MSLYTSPSTFGKDTWLDPCENQLMNEPGVMFRLFENEEVRIEGRNTFVKLEVGDSLGQGNIAEGGAFPAAGDPTYSEAKLGLARLAHTVELTLEEFELLNSQAAAAFPVVQRKLAKGVERMRRDMARQFYMDGTATLARCAATTASLTVNLQTSNGDTGSASQYDRDRWTYLEPNRIKIDLVDATTGAAVTNGTGRSIASIAARSPSGSTLVLDTAGGTVTTTTNTVIVPTGNVTSPGSVYTSLDTPGIMAAIATGNTYLNINRTSAGNYFWQSNVVQGATAGTNETISFAQIMKTVTSIAARSDSGAMPAAPNYCAIATMGVMNAYQQILVPAMRYDPTDTGDVGFPKLQILGMDMYGDIHAPHNTMIFTQHQGPGSFKVVKAMNPMQRLLDFVDYGGGMWHAKTTTAGAGYSANVQAFLTGLVGFYTGRPNNQGLLTDIAEVGTAW